MYCKNCGSQLSENDKFCKNCGTPTDNVEVSSQSINPTPSVTEPEVNQPVNTVEPTPSVTEPEVTQPVNTVQPAPSVAQQPIQQTNTFGQAPSMNNVQTTTSTSSSNNKKFIIIGGCVLAVILIVVGVFLLKDHDKKSKSNRTNVNEYEIDDNDTKDVIDDVLDDDKDSDDIDDDDDDTSIDQNSDEITLKKFKFKKVAGYEYKITSNKLEISNNNTYFAIDIVLSSFDALKTNSSQLITQFEDMGYTVKNVQTKTYGGTEYITSEVSKDNISMLMLFAKADNNYVFVIGAANRSYTIDYNLIYKVNTVIKNATYTG